jgi:hypothetical protein
MSLLNVSSINEYCDNIVASSLEHRANFILFPASSNLREGTWTDIGFELMGHSSIPVGLFLDRGYGSFSEELSIIGNQTTTMITDGCEHDVQHLRYIRRMIQSRVETVLFTECDEDDVVLDSSYLSKTIHSSQLIEYLQELCDYDLVVIGYECYSSHYELKEWLNVACRSSILIVG